MDMQQKSLLELIQKEWKGFKDRLAALEDQVNDESSSSNKTSSEQTFEDKTVSESEKQKSENSS